MSLAALAIRACTFLALYKRTLAEDRVYDSALSALDELIKEGPKPFLTVAIDECAGKPEGHNLLASTDRLLLVIETAIASPARVTVEGEPTVMMVNPATDRGFEWSLDVITHQVITALTSDPTWGDLWRRFVLSIGEVRRLRGGDGKGTRFAARQLILEVHPVSDPDIGQTIEPDSLWGDFLAALRGLDPADAEVAEYIALADMVETVIDTPALVDWKSAAARLGVSYETAEGLGFVPHPAVVGEPDAVAIEQFEVFGDPLTPDRADEVDGGDGEF